MSNINEVCHSNDAPASIVIPVSVEGYWNVKVYRPDGTLKTDTGRFKNLVVDNGLDLIATHPGTSFQIPIMFTFAALGTGNRTPEFSDTALETQVMSTNPGAGGMVYSFVEESGSTPAHWRGVKNFTFAAATADVNLQEIAVGFNATNIFSRALIQDSSGNPISLSIETGEIVIATYEYRNYLDKSDKTGTMDISGVTYDLTWRPTNISSPPQIDRAIENRGSTHTLISASNRTTLADVYADVSSNAHGSMSQVPYVPGEFTTRFTGEFGIGDGNFAGGIAVVLFTSTQFKYQILFDPPIPKDADHTLRLSFHCSWSRA